MRNSARYILMFVAVIVLLIVIVLLFTGMNRPNSSSTESKKTPTSLSSYANSDATVSYMVDGVIKGNDQYRAINIIVSKNARTIQILSGYQGSILKSQTTPNNPEAFGQFLAAIQTAGFLTERVRPTEANMAGQCPLGNRYIFTATNVADAPTNLWTSSCNLKTSGTWAGNYSTVSKLFNLQISNYTQFVSGVIL